MSSGVEDLVVTVAQGRAVAARVHGAGAPVFFLHGTPGSRVLAPLAERLPDELGVQVVTIDRPGYGASEPLRGRRATHCADDVVAVADALDAEMFAIAAWSGGALYALTAAARHPERVTSVALVSPLRPLDTSGDERALPEERALQVRLLRAVPLTTRVRAVMAGLVLRGAVKRRRGSPSDGITALAEGTPADAEVLRDGGVRALLEADLVESLRQGAAGWAADAAAMVEPWRLDPESVRSPVTIWHGTDDVDVRVGAARALARWLPAATLVEVAGAGHLALHTLWREVLDSARTGSVHG